MYILETFNLVSFIFDIFCLSHEARWRRMGVVIWSEKLMWWHCIVGEVVIYHLCQRHVCDTLVTSIWRHITMGPVLHSFEGIWPTWVHPFKGISVLHLRALCTHLESDLHLFEGFWPILVHLSVLHLIKGIIYVAI